MQDLFEVHLFISLAFCKKKNWLVTCEWSKPFPLDWLYNRKRHFSCEYSFKDGSFFYSRIVLVQKTKQLRNRDAFDCIDRGVLNFSCLGPNWGYHIVLSYSILSSPHSAKRLRKPRPDIHPTQKYTCRLSKEPQLLAIVPSLPRAVGWLHSNKNHQWSPPLELELCVVSMNLPQHRQMR